MIETRHIVTPVREFSKNAKFYEAIIKSIDFDKRQVIITHAIGRHSNPSAWDEHILNYDYLVIALGNENNFHKMADIEKHSFAMKDIGDAIILRNHIINMLEQANLEEKRITNKLIVSKNEAKRSQMGIHLKYGDRTI